MEFSLTTFKVYNHCLSITYRIKAHQAARSSSSLRTHFIRGSLNWTWSSSLVSGIFQKISNSESPRWESISISEHFGQLTESPRWEMSSTTVCPVLSSRSVLIVIMHLFMSSPPSFEVWRDAPCNLDLLYGNRRANLPITRFDSTNQFNYMKL